MADAKFVKNSLLDILVPEATDLDIENALRTAAETPGEGDKSLISTISQRSLLYFDENLPIYAILKTPYEDAQSLKGHISRLAIVLEAHAISSPNVTNPGAENAPSGLQGQARDVIWSSRLDVSEDPIIVLEGSDEEDEQDALLIWKMNAFLNRPRVRLQAPAVIFKVSASLQPAPVGNAKIVEEYLPSCVPFPINVLEPFGAETNSDGSRFHLSTSRLSRAAPSSQTVRSQVLPLRVISRRAFRAIPAISSRMRYHRANDATSRSMILASLELDIPVFAPHPTKLTNIVVKFSSGEAQSMLGEEEFKLPAICKARDSVTCLYALNQPDGSGGANGQFSTISSLDILVDAQVLVSEECLPQIQIRWKQNIDFATALNQKFNRVRGSIHRTNRPRSLSTATNGNASVQSGDPSRSSEDVGLSATITGQEEIFVGEPFKWDIFIINKSNKLRRLLISVQPKRRQETKRISSRPNSAQSLPGSRGGMLADAVVDENVLHAIMKSQSSEGTALVPLCSDVRSGPLAPGSCFSTQLELLPLSKGPLHVESIRITDIESNETVDIKDLPDIIVTEKA